MVESVVAEIVDEDTFQLDCASIWAEVFGSEATTMGNAVATMILEFEHCIYIQYQDLFQEPTSLPPACKDDAIRIHTIPGVKHPHM
jgi:hypothetical protein